MTLEETRRRLRADRERLLDCLAQRGAPRALAFSPAWSCVRLHRYSHLLHTRGHPLLARLLWHLNLWLTGADISPASDLGEGLLIVHPFAVTIAGQAGRNLTIEGWGGMGGGLAMDDIGAGPGLPVLGDDVRLDRSAMVLGPVHVGRGSRIGPGCTVVRDVEAGTEVAAPQPRVRRGRAA